MKKIRVTKYVSLRRDASATASPPCQALGADLDSVAAMLRGDPGTVVRLDVSRGGKAMAFPLSRAQFKVFFFCSLSFACCDGDLSKPCLARMRDRTMPYPSFRGRSSLSQTNLLIPVSQTRTWYSGVLVTT